ncbi:GNAT family N-acetyltransferase [Roseomonas sp. GCM10028921]
MTNKVVNNAEHHRFEMDTDDGHRPFIAYSQHSGTIVLTHTEVPEALSGRGIGSLLVRGALGLIRTDGLRVVPQCSFVAAYLQRHPEEQDLLAGPS